MGDPIVVLDTRVVTGTGGGPDKTILNSPRYLTDAGYRMICGYMHPPKDPGFDQIRLRAKALDAPLLSIPDRGPWDVQVPSRLLEICRREKVVIWHGHDYKSNLLGLLLKPFWPMRLVTTVHGWVRHTRRTPLYYALDRLCLRHYERVICVSEDLYRGCLERGVPVSRCLQIENAIDVAQYHRRVRTEEAKRRLGLDPARPVIGAVGRLSPEKGFDRLIRAADHLLSRGRDFVLLIAGEGDARPELDALINTLGLVHRIRLLGYCEDPIGLYQAMDILALSSLREGLPNVLLEAMALEVAVVATRVAGVPGLIHDEETGLLIEPGSVEELVDALDRLLSNDRLRDRLGRAGRTVVEAKFSFKARMDKIQALYDELLSLPTKPQAVTCRRSA